MPLIHYLCECGKFKSKFYRVSKDAPRNFGCECGKEYKKQLSAPSSASKIVVDNGVQAKAVEVDLNIIQSNQENSTKDFREKP
jgi:hypothetical protein